MFCSFAWHTKVNERKRRCTASCAKNTEYWIMGSLMIDHARSIWIYTRIFGMMLFSALSKNWHDVNFLHHLCVNHFVSALYNILCLLHYNFHVSSPHCFSESKLYHKISRCQKFAPLFFNRCKNITMSLRRYFFYPILNKTWIYTSGPKIVLCQNIT